MRAYFYALFNFNHRKEAVSMEKINIKKRPRAIKRLVVRLTEQEKQLIERIAKENQITISDYVKYMLFRSGEDEDK